MIGRHRNPKFLIFYSSKDLTRLDIYTIYVRNMEQSARCKIYCGQDITVLFTTIYNARMSICKLH